MPQNCELQTFSFPTSNDPASTSSPFSIRILQDEHGEPWFVAKDVCMALEIKNPSSALSYLDEDEKNTLRIAEGNRGNPNSTIVSESGLYSLILKSRKLEAKRFKKWVTSEVLPAIRKTGGYIPAQPEDDEQTILARAVLIAEKTISALKADNSKMHAKLDYSTVDAFRALHVGAYWSHGLKIQIAKAATKLCQERGIPVGKEKRLVETAGGPILRDINVYPTSILEEVMAAM